ncbi:MAG: restriction endonuclease subunit S [Sphingomonadales bacterium]|nr:restriction endonuclease subunit S [Sphingomonadales bacterium]
MSTALLGDLVQIRGGGTPDKAVSAYWGGSIPWASVKDFKSTQIVGTMDSITPLGVSNSATNVIAAGALLVPTRMAVGKAAINTIDVAINQDIKALLPGPRVDTRYLLHAILSKAPELERQATGATVKGITLDVLRRVEIPLPPLDEQQRIAAILDQADALRRKRREAIRQLDTLHKSHFEQIFGHPLRNEMGWPVALLGDLLADIEGGWSPTCLDRPAHDDEWGVLKLGAVTYGRFDDGANKALPQGVEPRPKLEVRRGDLLFTRKNTYELVAACALVRNGRARLLMPDLIFRLQLVDPVRSHPEFVHAVLSHPAKRAEVQSLASGAAGSMPNISKARLRMVPICLPPPELQLQFAEAVERLELMRSQAVEHLAHLDALFASLQHRAFRGEL